MWEAMCMFLFEKDGSKNVIVLDTTRERYSDRTRTFNNIKQKVTKSTNVQFSNSKVLLLFATNVL